MKYLSKDDGVIGLVQPNLFPFVKTNVSRLIKAERNAVIEGMAIAASVDGIKSRFLLVDFIERHDLEDLWSLKIFGNANHRYLVIFIGFGVYL